MKNRDSGEQTLQPTMKKRAGIPDQKTSMKRRVSSGESFQAQHAWPHVKAYLSFRDICATRPVCKDWSDISQVPHQHCVYFLPDGSNFDSPDSSDKNFRKCLLAATLHTLHCEISSNEELEFILQILPPVKDLTFEINLDDSIENCSTFRWDPYVLSSIATNVRRLELKFFNAIDLSVGIDFHAMKYLTHFETNQEMVCENYDGRKMDVVGYNIDHWNAMIKSIIVNTETLYLMRNHPPPLEFGEFLDEWSQNIHDFPRKIEGHVHNMPFVKFSKTVLEFQPVCLEASELIDFIYTYRTCLMKILNVLPSLDIHFDSDCDDVIKKLWIDIVNPVRQSFGLRKLDYF